MITTQMTPRLLMLGLLAGAAISLSACGTAGPNGGPNTTEAGHAVPDRAQPEESLSSLEKQYKHDPDNAGVAVRYARALRVAGRLSRASIIVSPYAHDERKPNAAAKTEYAAIQDSLGNYDEAAKFARKSIALDDKSYQSYHVLGIALDAKGDYPNAEDAYRKALALCQAQGDNPSAILNSLAMNLASQGFLDEATETLQKSLASTSDKAEVERDLRIVNALRVSGGRAPSYEQTAHDAKTGRTSSSKAAASAKPDAKAESKPAAPKPAPDKASAKDDASGDADGDRGDDSQDDGSDQ